MEAQIHWHEGLFLQPHHLQRMQKGFYDRISFERRLAFPYPYGVIEARLSRDDLENFRIRFERLRAVMPSGLEINYPGGAEIPTLDIKQAFARSPGRLELSLAAPLWFPARANTVANGGAGDARAKLLYRVTEVECADENSGENPKALQVRLINARLLLAEEDRSDMEVLPLLRILRAAGEDVGRPREDPDYAGPCLFVAGSPVLRELAADLAAQVDASRKALVVQAAGGGFAVETMRGVQFEQVMRLRTLNRATARLTGLLACPAVTPFALYLEFREILAELAALHPDRDDFETAPYDHDAPFIAFKELSGRIRAYLRGVVKEKFAQVEFKDMGGVLTALLQPDHVTAPNAYFLGIKTKQDPIALARLVEDGDKFKLMPQSLVRSAVRGIELKWDRQPPLGLPAASDLHYFRLDRGASSRRWDQVATERAVAIVWTAAASGNLDWADAGFSLYMTIPNANPS